MTRGRGGVFPTTIFFVPTDPNSSFPSFCFPAIRPPFEMKAQDAVRLLPGNHWGLAMTSLPGRRETRICILWLGIGAVTAITGCAVSSKSMQIDSTSRMPWFGLELKERSKKSEGPAFRAVKSERDRQSRIDTLGLFGGKTGDVASSEIASNPPKKVATALPTTNLSLGLDTASKQEPGAVDFR